METPTVLNLLNQIFDIQKKIRDTELERSLSRNLRRMRDSFSDAGYRIHDPTGEAYDLTRLDCEAMVSGDGTDRLTVVEVVKPIVYHITNGVPELIQKGVVLVEQKKS